MLDILGVMVCGMLGSESGGIVAEPISTCHIITKRKWFCLKVEREKIFKRKDRKKYIKIFWK